jgi:hypothetical protein
MEIQQSYSASSIAGRCHIGSVVPGANSSHRASQRSQYFVAWRAVLNVAQFGISNAIVPGAIVEVLHKMVLLKAAVRRRYNKWQQSDNKQSASPSVCCLCAWRYVSVKAR